MSKASIAEKTTTISIINRINNFIPISGFVSEVKKILDERNIVCKTTGKPYNENQIRFTRQLRAYHLPVALVFEELYDPNHTISLRGKQKPLIERQKLNIP